VPRAVLRPSTRAFPHWRPRSSARSASSRRPSGGSRATRTAPPATRWRRRSRSRARPRRRGAPRLPTWRPPMRSSSPLRRRWPPCAHVTAIASPRRRDRRNRSLAAGRATTRPLPSATSRLGSSPKLGRGSTVPPSSTRRPPPRRRRHRTRSTPRSALATTPRQRPMPRGSSPSSSPSDFARRVPSLRPSPGRATRRAASGNASPQRAGPRSWRRSRRRHRRGRRSRRSSAGSWRALCCGPTAIRATSSVAPADRLACWRPVRTATRPAAEPPSWRSPLSARSTSGWG